MQRPQITTAIGPIVNSLNESFAVLRTALGGSAGIHDKPEVAQAFSELETFCSIAVQVIKGTTPSKVRAATRAVEIQSYLQEGHRG